MKAEKASNIMRKIKIEKITLNIGAGVEVERIDKAAVLLERITGRKIVRTKAKRRIAAWKLRPGLPIGVKITVRGQEAEEILVRMLKATNYELPETCYTQDGLTFGVPEYIDIPDVKYDPKIGIIGLNVSVTLIRPGFRVKNRRLKKGKIPARHRISADEVKKFMEKKFSVKPKEEMKW